SIGLEKNAFLHVSETVGEGEEPYHRPQRGQRPRGPKRLIQNLLQAGQEVIVQVIRDPFGEKGPSVSMEVSLPGRFLVLTPLTTKVGISKKITSPQQRAQLRTIMRQLTEEKPSNVGFIVRTSSADTTDQDLRADFEYLQRVWHAVEVRAKAARAPASLYQETDLVQRTVRDFFTPDISRVVVDEKGVHQRLCEFYESVMPRFRDRLEHYEGATPLFHKYEIETQIEQLNTKTVNLPSGGSIVIEQTEGMTAIDVNSGRLVREANPEDLALKTNLEAAREIMRQLRLRDLGGIIVIDFIDMRQERHKRELEGSVREESRKDRSQMVILPLSQFCLLEIARQKTRPSLQVVSHDPCPVCGGSGFVKSIESMGLEVMRALKSTLDRGDIAVVEARVSPDVAGYLKGKLDDLQQLERKHSKRIHLTPTREMASNRVEFSCYNTAGEKVVDFVR
ncbi:MAG TPA: Rne/Rng family ribonuclease, partial [Planctomycetota bacterium]|nr:Rne/Rng family ribonuclease [Planctomycetota bacterium]